MTPPEARLRILREWLAKAEADMDLAEHLVKEGIFPGAAAFHSQQAAEKFLKAFLAWRGIYFPKTHDLEELLDLAETVAPTLAESLRDVIVLSPYGVTLRYPGDRPGASAAEAGEAARPAAKVRSAVLPLLP